MPETITPTEAETAALAQAITRAQGIGRDHDDRRPIVAAVLLGDEVIAWGDDETHVAGDLSRRAPVVAIAAALAERESDALDGATLVTTLEPCALGLATLAMSRIERLVFAAERPRVRDRYFAFLGLDLDEMVDAAETGIGVARGVMAADTLSLYAEVARD